jgi:3-hydroxybutyryl-CoA dehydrogenase
MESLICVCGAGTMGRGIALAAAIQGISAILYDLDPGMVSSAASVIEKELALAFEKKRISEEEKGNIYNRIVFSSELSACQAPLIIEAIVEKTESKSALFIELAGINSGDTVFASNTSSLSITQIAEQTSFPERVAGLHFFNPANRMKLVEVIRTKYTTDPIVERLRAFTIQLKKMPVICRDAPGFIVNRVARPFYLEALRLAEKQAADMSIIDKLMESAGFPMGPFHLMDLIGLDINYTVTCSVYEALGRPARMKPSPWQEDLVKQGLLGKKTGSGFFQYSNPISE